MISPGGRLNLPRVTGTRENNPLQTLITVKAALAVSTEPEESARPTDLRDALDSLLLQNLGAQTFTTSAACGPF